LLDTELPREARIVLEANARALDGRRCQLSGPIDALAEARDRRPLRYRGERPFLLPVGNQEERGVRSEIYGSHAHGFTSQSVRARWLSCVSCVSESRELLVSCP
jgi:hypothetical protein